MIGLVLQACTSTPEPPAPVVPSASEARPAPPEPPIVGLALGESTTCVRRSDDRTVCRGVRRMPPTRLAGALSVTDTAVCARSAGRVRCLRDGVDREAASAFVEVVSGAGGASCGRDPDGGVWCFRGTGEDGATLVPLDLPRPAVALAASLRTRALLDDGTLVSFDPYVATTGDGTVQIDARQIRELRGTLLQACWRTDTTVTCRSDGGPERISGIDRPSALAVGLFHGCALQDGVPWCWGPGPIAAPVPDVVGATAIAAGSFHGCALLDTGALRCWGRDDHGQVSGPFAP